MKRSKLSRFLTNKYTILLIGGIFWGFYHYITTPRYFDPAFMIYLITFNFSEFMLFGFMILQTIEILKKRNKDKLEHEAFEDAGLTRNHNFNYEEVKKLLDEIWKRT